MTRWFMISAVVLTVAASASPQHLRLLRSDPPKDSTVAAPAEITLWFSGRPTLAVSSVRLTHADTAIMLGPLRALPDSALQTTMVRPLPEGTYRVRWRTASSDGHPITGTFDFAVGTR
ncbi:MAG: copper resistance CopC family protein [Gemmatimonadales bacterium]